MEDDISAEVFKTIYQAKQNQKHEVDGDIRPKCENVVVSGQNDNEVAKIVGSREPPIPSARAGPGTAAPSNSPQVYERRESELPNIVLFSGFYHLIYTYQNK